MIEFVPVDITTHELARALNIPTKEAEQALATLEADGLVVFLNEQPYLVMPDSADKS